MTMNKFHSKHDIDTIGDDIDMRDIIKYCLKKNNNNHRDDTGKRRENNWI